MTSYNYLIDHIRRSILVGFLKDHPGMEPNQVIKEAVNSRFLFAALHEIIENAALSISVADLEKRGELAINMDERFKECQIALRASKYIVGHLFQHRFEHYNLSTKNEYEALIRGLEKEARKAANEMAKRIIFLVDWMGGERPTKFDIKENVIQYISHLADLLEIQYLILDQKAELIGIYITHVNQFMDLYYQKKKTTPPMASMKSMIHICKLIFNVEKVDVGKTLNRDALEKTIGLCEEHIEDLKTRQHELARVVHYLNPLVPERTKNVNIDHEGKMQKDAPGEKSLLARLFS